MLYRVSGRLRKELHSSCVTNFYKTKYLLSVWQKRIRKFSHKVSLSGRPCKIAVLGTSPQGTRVALV